MRHPLLLHCLLILCHLLHLRCKELRALERGEAEAGQPGAAKARQGQEAVRARAEGAESPRECASFAHTLQQEGALMKRKLRGGKECEKVQEPHPHRICSFFVVCGVLVLNHGSFKLYSCGKEGYGE